MISEVKKDDISYADSPTKFEAGTMQTAEVVAFAKSIKFIQDLGIKNIEKHESQILEYGLEKLRKDNSVNIIGNPKNRASIMSFTIKGIHPHDIATILDDDGVAIRQATIVVKYYMKNLEFLLLQELLLEFITVKKISIFYVSQLISVKRFFRFRWN